MSVPSPIVSMGTWSLNNVLLIFGSRRETNMFECLNSLLLMQSESPARPFWSVVMAILTSGGIVGSPQTATAVRPIGQ